MMSGTTWFHCAVTGHRVVVHVDRQSTLVAGAGLSGCVLLKPHLAASGHQHGTGSLRRGTLDGLFRHGTGANTWTTTGPQVSVTFHKYDVGLSVPGVELLKNTGVETLLSALRHSGLVRKAPTDIAAKLREMLGPSTRRKAGSEGFAACGIRLNKCYRELGQALKRLDTTLDAGKLFHP